MAGIKMLRKIQLGRETTAGTAVAASTIWRGLGTIEDQRETTFVDENVGLIVQTDRAYTPKLLAALEMESIPATFEQILHVFEAGIKLVQTGATDTGGSGKIYTYTVPTTTKNTIRTYTLEGGDDEEAEEMEYSFVKEFTLEGNAGEALMISSTWNGRQVTVSSFTDALTIPTVEEILFSKGKLYIDPVSGTHGGTLAANTWLSANLNVNTGWVPVFTADGNLYFSFAKIAVPEITLDLTFEHDSVGRAEKAAWRAGTPRLVRMLFEGSSLTTAGSSYTKKSLIIDLAGKWEKFEALGEQNGNDVLSGTFRVAYNATAAMAAKFIVVNELASVP